MKKILTLILPLSLVLWGFNEDTNTVKHLKSASDNPPAVVVELFTSQGCSSCPAADRLLSQLKESAQPVIPLSFHVSYWNYLGWTDPFSKEAFSKRQRTYARNLRSSVYTPQMVFNGSSECVGSSKPQVEQNIKQALKIKPSNKVELAVVQRGSSLEVKYQIEGTLENRALQIALVESMISVDVKRGENRGRTLSHDNVVRHFKTIPLHRGAEGKYQVQIPENFKMERGSVVAYVQQNTSLRVTGANQVNLN